MMSITLSNYIRVLKMIHSKQSRRKREKKKRNLELRIKALEKLAKRQLNNVHEISLSFVSLGDLRARWKSHRYKLDAKLLTKVSSFRKIKIERDESLCIRGWDNGLLVYGLHVNESLLVEDLYESIQALPEPKHYVYRGEKRSDYMTSHLCVWAKYSSKPFLSREYLDHKTQADDFFRKNKKLFNHMSGLLGQVAPGVFKQFQMYSLPKGLERLCGAWLGCVVNKGGNDPNQTNIHRDASEALYGYSCLISCGDYSGGELILYDLEIILELKAGDMILFPDAVIHHSNKAAEGNRCSVVAFTQENVYNYWNREYNMILRRKMRGKLSLKVK